MQNCVIGKDVVVIDKKTINIYLEKVSRDITSLDILLSTDKDNAQYYSGRLTYAYEFESFLKAMGGFTK